MLNLIKPNWLAPASVHAFSTTRLGGNSNAIYQGLNLGLHVQDSPEIVLQNRALLSKALSLPLQHWLNQTHSTTLVKIKNDKLPLLDADASWTSDKKQVCIVMTADCLPILLTDTQGSFVAAIHAGWRGLCDGIIEKSILSICSDLNIKSDQLVVWLGPCISKKAFVVGDEVRQLFIAENPLSEKAFTVYQDRYLADLHCLARLRLAPFNVSQISASKHCTFNEPERFYSYRRDGVTGRMATLIWLE